MEDLIWTCLVLVVVAAGGLGVFAGVMAWRLFQAWRQVVKMLGEAHREMLGVLVAKQVGDPRISGLAVNHLLQKAKEKAIMRGNSAAEAADTERASVEDSAVVEGRLG